MTDRSHLIPLAALALLAAACSEPAPSAPRTTPPTPVLGFINGQISGKVMTTTFVPLSGSIAGVTDSKVSASIYGQQGVTIDVLGVVDSLHDVIGVGPAGSRTWFTHVKLRNREAFPIGSNYGRAAALDTSGVFAFFTVDPNVSLPVPCVSCAVSVSNQSGTSNFTGATQKYFYYRNRPSAFTNGAPGLDTTNNIVWKFKTSNWNPGVTDTVHAFFFTLMVSAAWPPPQDSALKVNYDATVDTFPDIDAKPIWQKFHAPNGQTTLGSESNATFAELQLSAANANTSIYFSRNDSMGTGSAFMDVTARLAVLSGTNPQFIFGFAEPAGGKQVFVAITSTRVELGSFNNNTGVWTRLSALASFNLTGTSYHSYRLRKISNTSVALCVDGSQVFSRPYASLQNLSATFTNKSAAFGVTGIAASSNARITSLSYTIGSDGGGCPPP
jgi:hypothetical protein